MGKLVRIDLSCNDFTVFPTEALQSAKLTDIDLSANQVSSRTFQMKGNENRCTMVIVWFY